MRWIMMCLMVLMAGTLQASPKHHVIFAPKCLVTAAGITSKPISETKKWVLLDTDEAMINRLMETKHRRRSLMRSCGGFHDVTDAFLKSHDDAKTFLAKQSSALQNRLRYTERTLQYPEEVQTLLSAMNPQNMWTDLIQMTNFMDRYADSSTGVKAAEWIQSQVSAMAIGRTDVAIYTVPTVGYKQSSVVMKVGDSDKPGIVIGAHMDTVSGRWIFHMPGADDDGSGSVTVLEAARTVLASGMHFKKPIYFIWYAAEEEGLVGSGNVVGYFRERKIPVDAVLHFDMTGYEHKNDPTLWLLQDYTDAAVTSWLAQLATTYVKQSVDFTACGYDCSDHASWTLGGISAGAVTESRFEDMNPYLHTSDDTIEKLSLRHMTDYLKLAIAFAVEAAEPFKA